MQSLERGTTFEICIAVEKFVSCCWDEQRKIAGVYVVKGNREHIEKTVRRSKISVSDRNDCEEVY